MWFALLIVALLSYLSVVYCIEGLGGRSISSPLITVPISRRTLNTTNLDQNATTYAGISQVAMSSDKQSYFTTIKTGVITFRVALDTASSDLWIVSSSCMTNACKASPRYPLSYASSTFTSVNGNSTAFNVSYADGTSASGFVALESVQLANLTIPNQAFGVVTNSSVVVDDDVSGILGLGFPRLSSISNSVVNATPFFSALAQTGQLDYPLFGLSLTRNASGTLSIGAIDSSVVQNASKIGWNEVVEFSPFGSENNISSYFQWAIPFSGFSVNGTQVALMPTYPTVRRNISIALFDIGTAGIFGPYQDVSRIFALVDSARLVDAGSGQWAIPCDTTVPMSLTFGLQNYTLEPSDYLIGPAAGNPNLCLTWPRALPPSSDGIDWQIGTAFLRTVYSIFSYGINTKEPPMIGLYPLYNSTNLTESSDFVASFLSAASATVATTLPNFPLPTPSYVTPSYIFNTSVIAPTGGIVSSELATSTYEPVFQGSNFNASALPTISPSPTLVTFVITNAAGFVTTSVSALPTPTVTLGVPPGWNAGISLRIPIFLSFSCLILPSLGIIVDLIL